MNIRKLSILICILCCNCTGTLKISENLNKRFIGEVKKEKVFKGITWYTYLGQDKVLDRAMSFNLVDIDLNKAPVQIDFAWFNQPEQRATLSEVADTALAIVAVNSAYFEKLNEGGYVSFHKSHGRINQKVELPQDHTRFWKHQAAFVRMRDGSLSIIQGNQHLYENLESTDVISSAPLLISNGVPVGKYFVTRKTGDKSDLKSEHPDRHQAGFSPRTAFGLTPNNHLLLLTVDGRSPQAQGMNAEELTAFFENDLNAHQAINMDGGGSVTMFVRGATPTGVVNYPSDIRRIDRNRLEHHGQRRIGMALLIKPKSSKMIEKMKSIKVAPDKEAKDYHDSSNKRN